MRCPFHVCVEMAPVETKRPRFTASGGEGLHPSKDSRVRTVWKCPVEGCCQVSALIAGSVETPRDQSYCEACGRAARSSDLRRMRFCWACRWKKERARLLPARRALRAIAARERAPREFTLRQSGGSRVA